VRPALELRWVFWGLPAAVLVYGAAGLAVERGAVSSAFVKLGDASYTLYLQHAFITLTLGGLLKRGIAVHRLPPDFLIVLTVTACVPLAWLGYVVLERPMNQWLASRLFAPRRVASPDAFPLTGINPAETEPGA
jgi:peptidoglycan/LPS O-acetylase OafA/YrhL